MLEEGMSEAGKTARELEAEISALLVEYAVLRSTDPMDEIFKSVGILESLVAHRISTQLSKSVGICVASVLPGIYSQIPFSTLRVWHNQVTPDSSSKH